MRSTNPSIKMNCSEYFESRRTCSLSLRLFQTHFSPLSKMSNPHKVKGIYLIIHTTVKKIG